MDEDIIYYDGRNATWQPNSVVVTQPNGRPVVVNGHIVSGQPGGIGTPRVTRVMTPTPTNRTPTPTGYMPGYGAMAGYNPHAAAVAAMQNGGYPPGYAPYPFAGALALGAAGGVLGNMSWGGLLDSIGQIVAAVLPLPAIPPTTTGDDDTNFTNLYSYQDSLARYAKRDELIRTASSLLGKVLG